jgi:ATP-dependent DNA helicase Q1
MEKYLSRQPEAQKRDKETREEILKQMNYANQVVFGNSSFREQQQEIILSILRNSDVFVILPTGAGKSLCYQLPAVLSKGVTIVISPLLSLVEDQVSSLIQSPCGGIPSAYLSSTSTELMVRSVFNDLNRARHGL